TGCSAMLERGTLTCCTSLELNHLPLPGKMAADVSETKSGVSRQSIFSGTWQSHSVKPVLPSPGSKCRPSKQAWLFLLLVGTLNLTEAAEKPADKTLPVRGFCIPAPAGNRVDEFIKFIEEELAPRSVNALILRVDYGFQFISRP